MAGNNRIKGLTVEIDGDLTPLNKALSGTNREIKTTEAALKDVERLLKLDPTNTELIEQKQRLLSKAIEETENKLVTLREAEKQAQEQFARGEISQEQYDALKREIEATEQQLDKLETQAKGTSGSITATFKEVGNAINEAGDKVQAFGGQIEDAGKSLAPLSAAAAGVLGASGKMALGFEDAMAKASTLVDTTVYDMGELRDGILAVSNETGVAAENLAESMYNALSASVELGEDGAAMMDFLHKNTIIAKAGFTDIDTAVTATAKTLNAYGLEVSETGRIHNVLLKTQNLGITSVDALGQNLAKVTPTAAAMGVSIEQVGAALSLMTAQGTETAQATTQLNTLISELGKEGTKSSTILREKTGKSFKELMQEGKSLTDILAFMQTGLSSNAMEISRLMSEVDAATGATMTYEEACEALGITSSEVEGELIDLFGSLNAGKAALALGGDNAAKFTENLDEMSNGIDLVGESYEKLNTTSHKAGIIWNQVKNTGIELGSTMLEMLQPVIEWLSEKVSKLSEWVAGLDDGQKAMIVTVLALVAAIAPFLIMLGKMATGVGALIKVFGFLSGTAIPAIGSALSFLAANPIVLVIAAIVGLVALIATKGDEIQAILQKVDDFLQGIFAKDWTESFGQFGEILNTFFGYFKGIWDSIKLIFDGIIDFVRGVFTGDWERAWGGLQKIIEGVWNAIWNHIKFIVNLIIDGINLLWKGIYTAVKGIVDSIGGVAGALGDIFGKDWRFSMPANPPLIPKLAEGALIPPGRSFLAMLGDQSHGYNLEGPESMFRQIVREEAGGGEGGTTVNIDKFINNDTALDVPRLARMIDQELEKQRNFRRRAGAKA